MNVSNLLLEKNIYFFLAEDYIICVKRTITLDYPNTVWTMTKEDKKIRIAGYARVSTDMQAREGESLKVQEEEIKRYAAAHGYILAGIYTDKGVSGAKESRPQLDKLRHDAKEGKFDKVVFTKLSRFGRNTRNLLELFQEFEDEYKVGIVCIKENFDTSTSSGRFLRTLLAAVAEFERDTIRTQMRDGKLARLKRNEIFLGNVPYGYKFNKETKKMEIDKEESKIYLEIVDMFLNQNISINNVTLNLSRRGLKSPLEKRWSPSSISYMLKNSCYKGEFFANRYEYDMDGRRFEEDEEGNKIFKEKPEEDWIRFSFPPLIDEYKWDQLQQKIAFNAGKPKNEKYPHLFWAGGLIKCGLCGSKVSIKNGVVGKNGEAPHYYICCWSKSTSDKNLEIHNKQRCFLPSVRMEDVDNHLWLRIMNLLTYPENALKQALSEHSDLEELRHEKERIESELKTSDRKLRRIIEGFSGEEDEAVRDSIKNYVSELSRHIQELKNRLTEVKRELATVESNAKAVEGLNLKEVRHEIRKALQELPGVEKKHIIRILVSPETGGQVVLRPMTEGDRQLDDQVFKKGRIKASDHVPGAVVADFNFKVQGEKVIGAYEYLRNSRFLPNELKNSWLSGPWRA